MHESKPEPASEEAVHDPEAAGVVAPEDESDDGPEIPEEKPRKPREVGISWFAGFFDGEGNVQIARQVRRGTHATYQGRLCVTNTNLYVLQCIHLTYGGSLVRHSTAYGRSRGWRPSWRWTLTGDAAWKLARRMAPYIRVKYPALKLFRRFCAYKNQRDPNLITLYKYKLRMNRLNRRGV